MRERKGFKEQRLKCGKAHSEDNSVQQDATISSAMGENKVSEILTLLPTNAGVLLNRSTITDCQRFNRA